MNQMEVYAAMVQDDASPEEFDLIGTFFEGRHQAVPASKFFAMCGQYDRALRILLQHQLQPGAIDAAIELVNSCRTLIFGV